MKKVLAAIAIVGIMFTAANAQSLVGTVGSDQLITVSSTGGVVQAAGLDFASEAGLLIPIGSGALSESAAPFTFLLSNKATQVTFGNLGSTVTIDGDLKTSVGYTGSDPDSDLVASWGSGATPVKFPVNVVPEPASGLMAAFAMLSILGFRRRR